MSPMTKIACLLLAVVLMLAAAASAAVPSQVSYQGRLLDKNGTPLNGTYDITFAIYSTASGGYPLWSELHSGVTVADGLFDVLLGTMDPLDASVFQSGNRFLGIKVGANTEMTPREKLASLPYAIVAGALAGDGSRIELTGSGQTSVSLDPVAGYILKAIDAAGDTRFYLRMPTDSTVMTLANPNGESTDISTGVNAILIYNQNGELRLRIGLDEVDPIDGGGAVSFFTAGSGLYSRSPAAGSVKRAELSDSGLFLFGPTGTDTTLKALADGSIYGQGQVVMGGGSSGPYHGTTVFGLNNIAYDSLVTISGGKFNGAGPGVGAVVAGGLTNTAQGQASVVSGGNQNSTYGMYSVIPGGVANSAESDFSFAAGAMAHADHDACFVWSDTSNYGTPFSATGVNQFLIKAKGGVGIGTNAPAAQLHAKTTGLYAGRFECDSSLSSARALYAKYTGVGPFDAVAIYGQSTPADNYGYGASFVGGYVGSQSYVAGTGSGNYYGAYGTASTSSTGLAIGVYGYGYAPSGTAYAGYFYGNVHVTGTLTAGTKSFKIDHPLDPENKYLQHACVESPEMKNIYDGVVTLNASGEAVVMLPDYFDALNTEFRYQLTCIGGYAPVYIAQKIQGNSFRIAGGQPGMEVSWQVTGVRKDAYSLQNPIKVEMDKAPADRGKYLNPTAFGMPESAGIDAQRVKEMSERQSADDR